MTFLIPDESQVFPCPHCGGLCRAEWDWDRDYEMGDYQMDFSLVTICDCPLDEETARHLSYNEYERRMRR